MTEADEARTEGSGPSAEAEAGPVFFHDLSPAAQRMFLALLSQGQPTGRAPRRPPKRRKKGSRT